MPVLERTWITQRTAPWFVVGEAERPDVAWFVLHGLGQRAGRLAQSLETSTPPGTALVLPEGLSRALPRPGAERAGASWSTGEDARIDLADNLAWLEGLREHLDAQWQPRRWGLLGFSQGGLTAARWLAHGEARWDRVVLWGSPIPSDVSPHRLRSALGPTVLELAIGEQDPYAPPEVMAQAEQRLDALGHPWRLHRFSGGHEIPPQALREVIA
ncbi:MAG: hypothetical protein H6740_21600 [Alphaproteobacteria bacterium]|nr:hypothetical protein [Alphaproteobacteria bacterium]